MTVIVLDDDSRPLLQLPIDKMGEGLMPAVEDFERVSTALQLALALVETSED